MKNLIVALTLFIVGAPLAASATPHCQACPYSCADLGLGKKDCSQLSESRGLCCVDLTQRGLELAKEQERLLAKNNVTPCPAGFTPSEQRCSDSERKRGCRDQRVGPERRGCVSTGFR
ncbi:MAG: hypothetical protein RL417_1952 [Pseudomonadota bacterium]|jgi:hypothetical protein